MKRIKWQYTHFFNSKSSVQRVKEGEILGMVNHHYRHWNKNNAVQMARVKFDGNKGITCVPHKELKFVS